MRGAWRAAGAPATGPACGRLLHRDVKPANILLCPDGTAKLTDFGVAKDLETAVSGLTRSGMGLGTIGHMAPEQVGSAKHVDPAADVYGLGATLFFALTGRPPIEVKHTDEPLQAMERPPPPVRALRPDCPPHVDGLVQALLAREPCDRPVSAIAVAQALQQLQGG